MLGLVYVCADAVVDVVARTLIARAISRRQSNLQHWLDNSHCRLQCDKQTNKQAKAQATKWLSSYNCKWVTYGTSDYRNSELWLAYESYWRFRQIREPCCPEQVQLYPTLFAVKTWHTLCKCKVHQAVMNRFLPGWLSLNTFIPQIKSNLHSWALISLLSGNEINLPDAIWMWMNWVCYV